MPPWKLALLALVGLFAGFINVVAGGGSFITLPVLIFLGLPPSTANGTNRVGILIQNIFALWRFYRLKVFPWKFSLMVVAPAVAGALLGANLATIISQEAFKKALALLMVVVTGVTLYINPVKKLAGSSSVSDFPDLNFKRWALTMFLFFLIGIYGGFVQAGVGFFILSAVLLSGLDLVRGNAVKIFVVLIFTVFALGVFLSRGMVNWTAGLSLAVGTTLGGQLGAIASVKKGNKFIQRFVTVLIVIFALKLLLS